jgi:peptidoglycan/LPS O-acetylase OafA/YrhL
VGFALFALALHLHPFRIFVNRPLILIGKRSYSIYLVHFLVMSIPQASLHNTFGLRGLPATAVVFATFFGLAYLLSMATHRWIEQLGIAFGNKLIARLERGGAV